ncbi:AHH domain-containing protein [Haliangium ochraceum]|uniref:AHH domain-containing protein n=1 Tax=Haliangium ochraceum TaxID=80816 RepID=UPI001E38D584|nr:AHH domain-containing protein [Haliangium ochraceum]
MHRAFCGTEPPDAATPSAATPGQETTRAGSSVQRTPSAATPGQTAPSPPLTQAAGPSHPPAAPVQRKPAPARETPLTRARRTRAIGDIKAVNDFGPLSDAERLAFIRALLAQLWVGIDDEATLVRIWTSFDGRMLAVAGAHPGLWRQSLARGAKLDALSAVTDVHARFRSDVHARARDVLTRNEAYVRAEMDALGTSERGTVAPAASVIPEDEQADYLASVRERAEDLALARHAQARLAALEVGYERFSSKGGTIWHVARFKPDAPPSFAHDSEAVPAAQRAKDVRSWDEVKAHHERLQAVIAQLASASPVLYQAAAQGDDNALATMAAAPPGEARGTMAKRLSDQLSNVRTTQAELGSDLDELECTPLHEQLFAGAASASGTAWNAPGNQLIARQLIAEHARSEARTEAALATVAAAAFVIAEVASFGSATFFLAAGAGVAAGGTLAAGSWEHAEDLGTAANASTAKGGVVSRAQADRAQTTAIVNSALLFLDLIPAARAARGAATASRGARAGAREGAEQAAERAGREGAEQAGERAGREGAEQAGERAGREGAEQAGAEGAEQATKARRRLQPHEAANWASVARDYVGKRLVDAGPPPGYTAYHVGGRSILRRTNADDALFARLSLDGDGIIRAGAPPRVRVSNPLRKAESVGELLAQAGHTARPPYHQAHHVIPDEVVRTHPLFRLARERGVFDHDAPENIALLARSEVREPGRAPFVPEKVPGLSEGLPRHQGPHDNYSQLIMDIADDAKEAIGEQGLRLEDLSPEALQSLTYKVLRNSWQVLKAWDRPVLK